MKSATTPLNVETDIRPDCVGVALRSFDRQFLIYDTRVVDRPRPELWQTRSRHQIYVCEQHAHPVQDGPGLVFTSLVPNVDCFDGRGGRVLPLFRDAAATAANLAPRLIPMLTEIYGNPITAEDVLAYVAGTVGHAGYTSRFRDMLRTPGVRVPLTRDRELWWAAVELGRRVLWLHTFGERMADPDRARPHGLGTHRRPTYLSPVPAADDALPRSVQWEPETQTLIIGEDTLLGLAGRVGPVRKETWEYSVGGVQIVRKWFSYRHPDPGRRKRTSPLDDINPRRWNTTFDEELLDLLEVLDGCVSLEPAQDDLLNRICAGRLVNRDELARSGVLPVPDLFRRPPRGTSADPIGLT